MPDPLVLMECTRAVLAQGDSLPLWCTVEGLLGSLAAAGVGERPVFFVCHSLGGILVKELLARALADPPGTPGRAIAEATAGLAFYATPHRGSWLATWGLALKYIGAYPASVVVNLTPGPRLAALNEVIGREVISGRWGALSFGEGVPIRVAPLLGPVLVVDENSAFPGYGEYVPLPTATHIDLCKPHSRADPAYARLTAFLLRHLPVLRHAAARRSAAQQAEAQQAQRDDSVHMAALLAHSPCL